MRRGEVERVPRGLRSHRPARVKNACAKPGPLEQRALERGRDGPAGSGPAIRRFWSVCSMGVPSRIDEPGLACYFRPPMAAQDPIIGRDLLNGQFQILQKIGSGGMGSVYKAAPAGDEPDGGGQDPPPEAREPQGPGLALPPRGARDEPPHAPEHGEGVPVRRARGRLALHRDGVPRGQEPEPDGAHEGPMPVERGHARSSSRCAARSRRRTCRASSIAISSPRTSSSRPTAG